MLPQYEIMEILGRGGMGAVYKGRQKSLKRLVAIKILPLDAADDEMKFVERFQNEAQTMAAMNHPAIVAVYDFGETPDGLLYFIMEFVDGTDVHKMIQASGRLTEEHALAITAHVCDALSYAHKRGVIHRDIKPANILIDQEGHIKVADFGLAKMHDPSQTSGLTKTNMAMGTPDYVAPEVLTPGKVADHRADLYAVGVMLYQMLTGEVPRGMFKLPSQTGIGSDVRFDDIICKALEPKPEDRYQSAMDVRHALDVILTTPQPKDDGAGVVSVNEIPQKPVTRGPRPPGEKSADSPAQRPQQRAAAPQKSADKGVRAPAKKPSRASTWLGIGGIVAVVSVAAFMVFSSKPKPEPVGASASAASGITPNLGTISPPQAANAPPQISNWQDVTGALREKLATKQGYVVDASGVHRAPGAPNGDTMVMAPSEKDRAVRVRYIGQSQVTLWFKGGSGGAYVLATKTSTMFKRQAQKDGEAVSIIPSVVHPAGFDPALSHELIVVVKGSAVRAWLDGVYLGDAEDAALGDCSIAIWPMTSSTVQKVEIAELAAEYLKTQNAPSLGAWTDRMTTTTWVKPWALRDGVLSVSSASLLTGIGWVQDGAIRVRARVAAGASTAELEKPVLQMSLRAMRLDDSPDISASYVLMVRYPGDYCWLVYAERNMQTGTNLPDEYLWERKRVPPSLMGKKEIEWEFRAVGDEFSAWADGELVASARDARLRKGDSRLVVYPSIEVSRFETRGIDPGAGPPLTSNALNTVREITGTGKVDAGVNAVKSADSTGATVAWTDWMGSSFARGQFRQSGFVAEKDGITTDQESKGVGLMEDHALEGPVRLTYLLRDSKGAKIIFRNLLSRDMYIAEDSGIELNIYRVDEGGGKKTMLASEKTPATLSRTGERTLEFRVEGEALKATVNGTLNLSARDATLTTGPGSFVGVDIKKGLLLKKVEIAD